MWQPIRILKPKQKYSQIVEVDEKSEDFNLVLSAIFIDAINWRHITWIELLC